MPSVWEGAYQEDKEATYRYECSWQEEQSHECDDFHGHCLRLSFTCNHTHVMSQMLHVFCRFPRLISKDPVGLHVLEVKEATELGLVSSFVTERGLVCGMSIAYQRFTICQ